MFSYYIQIMKFPEIAYTHNVYLADQNTSMIVLKRPHKFANF